MPFSTLFETAAEKIAQSIDFYRPRLHELSFDVLEKLPLSKQERSQLIIEKVKRNIDGYSIDTIDRLSISQEEKIKLIVEKISKNINAYRDELTQLTEDVLNQLPLTPAQRANIATEKRRIGQQ